MGFEPTRAEPIGLAVQRLNHSATSSLQWNEEILTNNQFWLVTTDSADIITLKMTKVLKCSHAGS